MFSLISKYNYKDKWKNYFWPQYQRYLPWYTDLLVKKSKISSHFQDSLRRKIWQDFSWGTEPQTYLEGICSESSLSDLKHCFFPASNCLTMFLEGLQQMLLNWRNISIEYHFNCYTPSDKPSNSLFFNSYNIPIFMLPPLTSTLPSGPELR